VFSGNLLRVSGLHFVLERNGDECWMITDKSTNGTFVNGEQLEKNVATCLKEKSIISAIKPGKEVTIKDNSYLYKFIFMINKEEKEKEKEKEIVNMDKTKNDDNIETSSKSGFPKINIENIENSFDKVNNEREMEEENEKEIEATKTEKREEMTNEKVKNESKKLR